MASATRSSATPRDRIERRYGGPLPEETWAWLVTKRYIEEFESGMLDAEEIAEKVRELNRVAPRAIHRDRRLLKRSDDDARFATIDGRMQAVAEILALRASRDLRVTRFRRAHLPEALLDPEQTDEWIEKTYWSQLPAGWPRTKGPAHANNFAGNLLELPSKRAELQWLPPDATSVKIWGVPPGSILGRLAEIVDRLAPKWDWHPAHATSFVLTGAVPPRPGVRQVRTKPTAGWDDRYGPYSHMAVRASIDVEMTPEELAAWWRGIRASLGTNGRKPIRDKAVRLARFAMERDDTSTWREIMGAWNRDVPEEWHFNDHRNFRTAVLHATQALNSPVPPSAM